MWGGACFWYLGNRKCLKQSFHYKINKDRELLQYMYLEKFVFYLPYIPKKNQQKNMSHAIATKTAKHFYWGHSTFHFYILFQRFCQSVSKFLGEIFCQQCSDVSGMKVLECCQICVIYSGNILLKFPNVSSGSSNSPCTDLAILTDSLIHAISCGLKSVR